MKNEVEKDKYSIGSNTDKDAHPALKTIEQTTEKINEVNFFIADDSTVLNTSKGYRCKYTLFSKYTKISKEADSLNGAYAYVNDLKIKDSVYLGFFMKAICKAHHLYELDLFSDMGSYYELIKNDAPQTKKDIIIKHEQIKKGYVGKLRQGVFYYYD